MMYFVNKIKLLGKVLQIQSFGSSTQYVVLTDLTVCKQYVHTDIVPGR
jgi:hypothetical protein